LREEHELADKITLEERGYLEQAFHKVRLLATKAYLPPKPGAPEASRGLTFWFASYTEPGSHDPDYGFPYHPQYGPQLVLYFLEDFRGKDESPTYIDYASPYTAFENLFAEFRLEHRVAQTVADNVIGKPGFGWDAASELPLAEQFALLGAQVSKSKRQIDCLFRVRAVLSGDVQEGWLVLFGYPIYIAAAVASL
jgi:hypothetical protein